MNAKTPNPAKQIVDITKTSQDAFNDEEDAMKHSNKDQKDPEFILQNFENKRLNLEKSQVVLENIKMSQKAENLPQKRSENDFKADDDMKQQKEEKNNESSILKSKNKKYVRDDSFKQSHQNFNPEFLQNSQSIKVLLSSQQHLKGQDFNDSSQFNLSSLDIPIEQFSYRQIELPDNLINQIGTQQDNPSEIQIDEQNKQILVSMKNENCSQNIEGDIVPELSNNIQDQLSNKIQNDHIKQQKGLAAGTPNSNSQKENVFLISEVNKISMEQQRILHLSNPNINLRIFSSLQDILKFNILKQQYKSMNDQIFNKCNIQNLLDDEKDAQDPLIINKQEIGDKYSAKSFPLQENINIFIKKFQHNNTNQESEVPKFFNSSKNNESLSQKSFLPLNSDLELIIQLMEIILQIKQIQKLNYQEKEFKQDSDCKLWILSENAETCLKVLLDNQLVKNSQINIQNPDNQTNQETIEPLQQQIEDLKAKLRSQSIFISMVIHDLRNPTNAVIFMIDSIKQELEEEFKRVNEVRELFQANNFQAFNAIQKGIELSSLTQQSINQELQAINNLLNGKDQRCWELGSGQFKNTKNSSGKSGTGYFQSDKQLQNFQEFRILSNFEEIQNYHDSPNIYYSFQRQQNQWNDISLNVNEMQNSSQRQYTNQNQNDLNSVQSFNQNNQSLKKPKTQEVKQNFLLKKKQQNIHLSPIEEDEEIIEKSLDQIQENADEEFNVIINNVPIQVDEPYDNDQILRIHKAQQFDSQQNAKSFYSEVQQQMVFQDKFQNLKDFYKMSASTPFAFREQLQSFQFSEMNHFQNKSDQMGRGNFIDVPSMLQPLQKQNPSIQKVQQNSRAYSSQQNLLKQSQNNSFNQKSLDISDDQFNIADDDCDEFKTLDSQRSTPIIKPSQRFQRDFISKTNNLSKIFNATSRQSQEFLDYIEKKMQKFIKNDQTEEITENMEYQSLYELISVNENRVVILEKQYIFTGATSIIPGFKEQEYDYQNQSQQIQRSQDLQAQVRMIKSYPPARRQRENKLYPQQKKIQARGQGGILGEQSVQLIPQNLQQIQQQEILSQQNQAQQQNNLSQQQNFQTKNQPQIIENIKIQNFDQQQILEEQICSLSNEIANPELFINKNDLLQIPSSSHMSLNNLNKPIPDKIFNNPHQIIIQTDISNQSSQIFGGQAQLHSMAHQAQILLKLQSNSSIESHQALQQLNKIKETVATQLLSENKVQYLSKLINELGFQGKMFLNLINDLLDYAKFENGNFEFLNENFDLAKLIQQNAFSTISFQVLEKKIDIVYSTSLQLGSGNIVGNYDFSSLMNSKFNVEEKVEKVKEREEIIENLFIKRIWGDERRYLQILLNFLSNSIKFTKEKGKIQVNVKIIKLNYESNDLKKKELNNKNSSRQILQSDDQIKLEKVIMNIQNENMQIHQSVSQSIQEIVKINLDKIDQEQQFITMDFDFQIEIIDNGIGIKPENIGKLFMEFGKLDEQSKMNRQGTGLGLTISRNMVRQMGGDIIVSSKFGKGTTFFISLSTKTNVLIQDLKRFEIQNQQVVDMSFKNKSRQEFEKEKSQEAQEIKNENNDEDSLKQLMSFSKNLSQNIESLELISESSLSKSEKVIEKQKNTRKEFKQSNDMLTELLKKSLRQNQNLLNQINSVSSKQGQSKYQSQVISNIQESNLQKQYSNLDGFSQSFSHHQNSHYKRDSNIYAPSSNEDKKIISGSFNEQELISRSLKYVNFINQNSAIVELHGQLIIQDDKNRVFDDNITPVKKQKSSLSSYFLKSLNQTSKHELLKQEKVTFKCLLVNDESFQLQMMSIIFQKENFIINTAENGHSALHKVMQFINQHNQIREILQKPGPIYKQFTQNQMDTISSTLKNYDLIILDLNMPIMNGYVACERICQLYKSFNCLPDFDHEDACNQDEKKYLDEINQMIQDNVWEQMNEINLEKSSLNSQKSSQVSQTLNILIDQVKSFYKFKSFFNNMLRVKPLIVACSADVNQNVKSLAKQVGFDYVIQAPITQKTLKEDILLKLVNKQRMYENLKLNFKNNRTVRKIQVQSYAQNFELKIQPVSLSDSQNTLKEEKDILENLSC